MTANLIQFKPSEIKDIGDTYYNKLKAIPITDIISSLGIVLENGNKGNCPSGHESKNEKCFTISEEENLFNCFHCKAGGSNIDLIMFLKKCSKEDACIFLAENFLPELLPEITGLAEEKIIELKEEKKKQETVYEALTDAIQYYHSKLLEQGEAIKYLQSRGLSEAFIKDNQYCTIGFSSEDDINLYSQLLQRHGKDTAIATGLFYTSGAVTPFFKNLIVVSYQINKMTQYMVGRSFNELSKEQRIFKKLHTNKIIKNKIFGIDSLTITNNNFKNSVLIAEGLFDALLVIDRGFPTISPITTEFSKDLIDDFVETVKPFDVVYIIPDPDKAGMDGGIETGKRLFIEGKKVKLVLIPQEKPDCKIDLADYLRDHTTGEFLSLIQQSRPIVEYLIEKLSPDMDKETLDKELRENIIPMIASKKEEVLTYNSYIDLLKQQLKLKDNLINQLLKEYSKKEQPKPIKIDDNFMPIKIEGNKYLWGEKSKEGIRWEAISNFVIELKNTIQTPYEKKRFISLKNTAGKSDLNIEASAEQLSLISSFKIFCMAKGDYIFNGSQAQLDKLWEYLYETSKNITVIQPEEIGKLNNDIWLMGDCVVYPDGQIQDMVNGIVQKDNTGYKIGAGRSNRPFIKTDKLNIPLFLELLKRNLGYKALLGTGFITATLLSDVVYEKERCFPLLFLFGRRQSGKNTYGRWLMKLCGYDTEGRSYPVSTPKGVFRSLAQRSNLPFWLNEYRNDGKKSDKKEFLLNIYNREGYVKAETSNDQRTVDQDIKGTLIISGQETPKDNGIFSRCIILQFSEKEREEEFFEPINQMWEILPDFTMQILQNLTVIKELFFEIFPMIKEILKKASKHDPRVSINYSIVTTGVIAISRFFKFSLNEEEFLIKIAAMANENKQVKDQETEVAEFWDIVESLFSRVIQKNLSDGEERTILDSRHYVIEKNQLYLWFSEIYKEFSKEFQRLYGKLPFKESALKEYLREEPYFLHISQLKKIKGHPRRCIVLDYEKFKKAEWNFLEYETD